MFLASNCTCTVYFTYTAHVQLLAKNMAATHVHVICTCICIRNQTPYTFVAKIILCMYLLYGCMERHVLTLVNDNNQLTICIIIIIRWPRSVTTQFKLQNTFQCPQHISKTKTQCNNYSKHISKFETQFDNCPQHISLFTTHFQIQNTIR